VDTYFVGGRDDYLDAVGGLLRAYRTFRGRHEFVLSTSGHVQSVLRPPRLPNVSYFTNAARRRRRPNGSASVDRAHGTLVDPLAPLARIGRSGLWPKGDAWGGGGHFLRRGAIALNHREKETALADGLRCRNG